VGISAAAITAVAAPSSPQTIAGVVTGIGFIGGGVVFRGRTGTPHGITTAATIFASAALGIVAGFGRLVLAVAMTAGVLVLLELPHLPALRLIDARTFARRFVNDPELPSLDEPPDTEPPPQPDH
jgi:putative Mg2+ transporter-C (MgtC) family protein